MKRDRGREVVRGRAALAVLGMVVVAASVIGLLVATGAVEGIGDWVDGSGPVLAADLEADVADDLWIFQIVALVVGVVLVLLGWLWLRGVIPVPRGQHDIDVGNGSSVPGTTRVGGAALAELAEQRLEARSTIEEARAWFRPDEAELDLRITLDEADGTVADEERAVTEVIDEVRHVTDGDGAAVRPVVDIRLAEHRRQLA